MKKKEEVDARKNTYAVIKTSTQRFNFIGNEMR